MVNKVWDERQKRWVAADPSVLAAARNNTNTSTKTSTNTTNNSAKTTTSNWSYYPKVTGKQTTSNAYTSWQWDTSYVKDAWYYRQGNNWDYNADIKKDYNRAEQMKSNIKQDSIANPKLFENRADFEKYYHYNDRHGSQKQLLDEAWDNYSKYGLNSTENSYADDASAAATDKNTKKMKVAANTYKDTLPYVMDIRNKLNERLQPVFDQLKNYQAKYLNDMAELRKLQNDYYAGMKREYDALAAWQSASIGSTLSGQWLSQSAIASTVDWVDKNWQSRYNDLMQHHIETLKWLQDSEQTFMNSYGTLMWNLTTAEQWALNDWLKSFKDLRTDLDNVYYKAIDEKYAPYEALTQAKVSGAAETATSAAKTDNKQAQYQWADDTKKRSIIYNQLYWLLSWTDINAFNKLEPYIANAVAQNPNDWQAAITAVLTKAWIKSNVINKVVDKIIDTPDTEEQTTTEEETPISISTNFLDKYK